MMATHLPIDHSQAQSPDVTAVPVVPDALQLAAELPMPPGWTMVRTGRALVYVLVLRCVVYVMCVSGLFMGARVGVASRITGARFTALAGLPGWPEVWGWTLAVAGLLALAGRLWQPFQLRAGVALTTVAMAGMSCWYLLFASSLVLGTAEYGYVPYYALACIHGLLAWGIWSTDGFTPARTSPAS